MRIKGWTEDGRKVELVLSPQELIRAEAVAEVQRRAKIAAKRKEPLIVSVLLLVPRIMLWLFNFWADACWAATQQGSKQEYTQWLYGTGRYANKD